MLLRHSAIYLFARGLPALVNFLAIAVFTRLLSPEEYGQYSIVLASVALLSGMSFQWLQVSLIRFFSSYEKLERLAFLSTVAAAFCGLLIVSGILGAIVWAFWPDIDINQKFFFIGIGLLWANAGFELNSELLRSQLKPSWYGWLAFTKSVLALILGVVFVQFLGGAIGVLFGTLLGTVLPSVWIYFREWRSIRFDKARFSILKQLFYYGAPLSFNLLLMQVLDTSARLFLGWLASVETAGLYSVGFELAQKTLGILMMIVVMAGYPWIVQSWEKDEPQVLISKINEYIIALLVIAFPASMGIALLADNIARVFLGKEYWHAAGLVIPWISAAILLAGIKSYILDLAFLLGKNTVRQIWVAIIAAGVCTILYLWWIPAFGMMGAVYATLLGYLAGIAGSWLLGRHIVKISFPFRETGKIMIATLVMAAALLPLRSFYGQLALLIQLSLGALVYFVIIAGFNILAIRTKMFNILRGIIKRSST